MPRPFRKPEPCKVEGCDRLEAHLGMCIKHYTRFKKHGDPHKTLIASAGGTCTVCGDKAHARGLCNKHYHQWERRQ